MGFYTLALTMAVGKNKGLNKSGKKGSKKRVVDPFTRKDWYDVKSPALFTNRNIGKTLVNRTQGTKIASEGLKSRVFEVSLADLQNEADAERSFRKFRLIAEEVQGKNVLCNFHGFSLTTDKMRSMVKKWQTCIEGNTDVKTTDGYLLRVFCVAFTEKMASQTKKTAYAQHTQVKKLIPDTMADDIRKACNSIYPLKDVHIRKVKVLKKPRFDLGKLLEMHGESGKSVSSGEDVGSKVDRPDNYEPPIQSNV